LLNLVSAKNSCGWAKDAVADGLDNEAIEEIGAAIEQLKSAREKIRGEMRKEPANA
jgi:hypothetical protein